MAVACLAIASVGSVAAQSRDPLVSKHISRVAGAQGWLYAVDGDGTGYSALDLFLEPSPAIATYRAALPRGLSALATSDSLAIAVFRSVTADTTPTLSHVALLTPGGAVGVDSLRFRFTVATKVALGTGFSGVAASGSRMAVAAGYAGIAYTPRNAPAGGAAREPLQFLTFTRDADTAFRRLTCAFREACSIDSMTAWDAAIGQLDSIGSLALDTSAPGGTILFMGTQRGLRRGIWESDSFPKVAQLGLDTLRIHGVFAQPQTGRVWVFAPGAFFYSDDHGLTFSVPPEVADIAPSREFSGAGQGAAVAFAGDTAFVNFARGDIGVALFRRDTVLAAGSGTGLSRVLSDPLLGNSRGADFGAFLGMASVERGGRHRVAIGSQGSGVFYTAPLDGGAPVWRNLDLNRRVSGSLGEVLTYPTVFTGARGNLHVNFGYRLGRSAKVTITVHNYAMEKVRTVVREAQRQGGQARSENPLQDRWDGRDDSGRPVSIGVYYVRIESSAGETGWGKVIIANAR